MRLALLAACACVVAIGTSPASGADEQLVVAFQAGGFGSLTDPSDVVLVNATGARTLNLTPPVAGEAERASEHAAAWSPDGTQLAYAAHNGVDREEIAIVGADGTGRRMLTTDSGGGRVWNTSPEWAPDGRHIAWLKTASNDGEVWVMQSDGSGQRPLTATGGRKRGLAWSPDGTRLLVETETAPTSVLVIDLGTGTVRDLAPDGAWDSGAAWSPDGRRIAFTSGTTIMLTNADGSDRRRLATTPGTGSMWSPDGRWIAFTGTRSFPGLGFRGAPAILHDVFVVAADGSSERRLTGARSEAYLPGPASSPAAWWPDGSRLFIATSRAGDARATWVVNADGTCEAPFGPPAQKLVRPRFRPGYALETQALRCADLRVRAQFGSDAAPLRTFTLVSATVEHDGSEPAVNPRIVVRASRGTLRPSRFDPACAASATRELVCTPVFAGGETSHNFEVAASTAGPLTVTVEASSDTVDSDPTTNRAAATIDVLPCSIVGSTGADRIVGTPRRDTICARPGWDIVDAGAGDDRIEAGSGNDTVIAGPGRDTVIGGGGWDTVVVRDGRRDWVACGVQRDTVVADRIDRVAKDCERVLRR